MIHRVAFCLFWAVAAPCAAEIVISPEEKAEGFRPLFNGRSLREWSGDRRLWAVNNSVIVGTTDNHQIAHNNFLTLKREYADFHMKFQVRLRNGNSGVQFRSEELPDFIVRGLQADMAEDNWWGSIYDERGRRGVVVDGWKDKAEKVVKKEDWNDYEIYAKGDTIWLKVNGVTTAELKDSSRTSGVIALQLHRGLPMKVYFRNLRIKEL